MSGGGRPVPSWLVTLGLCAAHSALAAASLEPVNWWWLSLIAVAPVACAGVLAGERGRRPWRHGVLAAIGLLPLWLLEMSWVSGVSAAGYVPVSIYLSLYAGVFVWMVARVTRRWGRPWGLAVSPLAWAALEVLRGRVVFDGFAWFLTGHPLIEAGWTLAWPARVGGEMFVSLLAATTGCLVLAVLLRGARLGAAVSLAALTLLWVGPGLLSSPPSPPDRRVLRVGVVQTNVPQSVRGNWSPEDRYARLGDLVNATFDAADVGAELIVWPETMFPGIALEPEAASALRERGIYWRMGEQPVAISAFADTVMELQRATAVPLLVGASGFTNFRAELLENGAASWAYDARFNAAFVVRDASIAATYRKLRLTPFGEVMPYVSAFPWLERSLLAVGAAGMAFDLAAGRDASSLDVAEIAGMPVRVAAPICFEVTDAGVTRRLVRGGEGGPADLIVNMTNDGWFGDWRPGRLHHMLGARWRCIELDRPMVRAANTGVSAVIDRTGRIVSSGVTGQPGADRVAGVLVDDTELGGGLTPYAAWGWATPWALLAMGAVPLALALAPRRCDDVGGTDHAEGARA